MCDIAEHRESRNGQYCSAVNVIARTSGQGTDSPSCRAVSSLTPERRASDDKGVSVYMDVPGIHGEDLAIELENDILSIRGERPFPYADAIQAALTHGVLELRIPKPESLKPHRIPIQARTGDGAQPQVVEGSAQNQNA
jgi:hypothetical protein